MSVRNYPIMKFGAVFPHHDFGNEPGEISRFTRGVEDLGFDHLVAYDHVLGAPHEHREPPLIGPYDESHGFHEVLVLFGYLAAITRRVELTVGVLVAPQRQTALIAKQAAEVQILSSGRLRLGLGTGWNHVEYTALGATFDRRGEILDEQATVLRQLWNQPLVDIDTPNHRIPRAGLKPLPEQPIPIWFGGYSTPAYRRSARDGDGHIFGHLDQRAIEGASQLLALVDQRTIRSDQFGLEAIVDVRDRPEQAESAAQRWAAAGGTHLTLRTMTSGARDTAAPMGAEEHLELLGRALTAARGG